MERVSPWATRTAGRPAAASAASLGPSSTAFVRTATLATLSTPFPAQLGSRASSAQTSGYTESGAPSSSPNHRSARPGSSSTSAATPASRNTASTSAAVS